MLVKQWLMFDIFIAVRVQRSQLTSQLSVLGLCEHAEVIPATGSYILLTRQRQYIFNMHVFMY